MRRQLKLRFNRVPYFWRYGDRIAERTADLRVTLARAHRRPIHARLDRLAVHCTYHKAGSTWINNVLSDCADHFALFFQNGAQKDLRQRTDIFVCGDGALDLDLLPPHVGTHMMRDPRDLVVSGYHYHKWTNEPWVYRPVKGLGGLSRQQYLNAVDRLEGMKVEIEHVKHTMARMLAWPRHDPRYLNITYEDLIADEAHGFRRIFEHYGFQDSVVSEALEIASRHSFSKASGRKRGVEQEKNHLRSGKSRQWAEEFTPELKDYFKEVHGDALVQLGYEESNDW